MLVGMNQKIHPKYYTDAIVTCNGCGTTYTIGSTKEKLSVELCSNCHPFYTGKQKLVDTAGRVDRFRARAAKAGEKKTAKASAKPTTAPKAETESTKTADSPTPEERLAKMKAELTDDDSNKKPEQ